MSIISCIIIALLIVGCREGPSQADPINSALVSIRHKGTGQDQWLRVEIELGQLSTALDFGPVVASPDAVEENALGKALRLRRWHPDDEAFIFEERAGRIYAVRRDAKPFNRVTFRADVDKAVVSANYQPTYLLGAADGAQTLVLYTGHFWPFDQNGRRMVVNFDIVANTGEKVMAFGKAAARLEAWQSPYNHPAFLVFGQGQAIAQPNIDLYVNSELPSWIYNSISDLSNKSLPWLATHFGRSINIQPTMIVSGALNEDITSTVFHYSGDALPGQILTVLAGTPWLDQSQTGETILERATVHEFVHLWQTLIRPSDNDVPAWIHEGAAEAIAAETLVAIGRWTEQEAMHFGQKARSDCIIGMREQRLDQLRKATHFRTVYACGQVLAQIAAGDGGSTQVTQFWRDYIKTTLASGTGYSFDGWIEFTGARTNNEELANGLRSFVHTRWSKPGAEIDRLTRLAQQQRLPQPEGLAQRAGH